MTIQQEILIREVKQEASQRILAVLPEWKQLNLTARSVQLVNKKLAGTLSVEEGEELSAIEAIFDNSVKKIRDASDMIETEIMSITNDQLSEYPIHNNKLWPNI